MIIRQMDMKTDFLNGELDEKVDLTKELLSLRFSMKDIEEADVILGIKIHHESNRIEISQSHYIKKALKYLKKTMDYKLTYTGYPLVLEGYIDTSWINNYEDNSFTSGGVFLICKGAISWASKKQTCITGTIIESKFMALAAAGKETEWLRNLILKILLWSKLITPIFIRWDSAATLAKAYSKMHNRKSRHLGLLTMSVLGDDKEALAFEEDEPDDLANKDALAFEMSEKEALDFLPPVGKTCTSELAEVYYECMEPFKSLMCLWVRSRSIAVIWLEKVVTPLIEPPIKGFTAATAVLKPEHLKVDKTRVTSSIHIESPTSPTNNLFDVGSRRISITQAAHSKTTDQIIESVHWKSFGENVGQLLIGLAKVQLNRTFFYVLLDEMVSDRYMFHSGVLNWVAGYGNGGF
nr:zinc finger, CCHC-type [Tanacetum cinerariifolium]